MEKSSKTPKILSPRKMELLPELAFFLIVLKVAFPGTFLSPNVEFFKQFCSREVQEPKPSSLSPLKRYHTGALAFFK